MIYRKLFSMLTAGLFVFAVSIPAMASDQNAPIEKEIQALDMSWGQAAAKSMARLLINSWLTISIRSMPRGT